MASHFASVTVEQIILMSGFLMKRMFLSLLIHVRLKSLILLHLTSFDHLTSHVTLRAQRAVFIVCICCCTVKSGKPNFGSADY